ncbi:MAG TPA: PilZ domain-containing protein [Candidatus Tenderia electrophaga]|uniref:PilZ domain-containing protein n=1 Tax=Candidatus Tenderia electrophaga TaxID=1748243 RepID=A0A832J5Z3_9GAMM|nr:PilZ domain-containing protein [Candidatus Tenderia electrophaga]
MERRWSRRKQVGQDVLLHVTGQDALSCTVRDISFEGARIEVGSLDVALSAQVGLSFYCQDKQDMVRLEATVVRLLDGGVGVHFSEYHDGSCRYLLELLD